MTKSQTEIEFVHPSAGLYLTGNNLDPQEITAKLGVNPLRSYKRGDKQQNGEKNRSHGLWMLSSSEEIDALDITIHIQWLLDQLEPAKVGLVDLLQDKSIDAVISCFWAMPSSHEVLIITPELLQRIASLSIRFKLAVLGPNY
jgi:hypothetical protein